MKRALFLMLAGTAALALPTALTLAADNDPKAPQGTDQAETVRLTIVTAAGGG